MRIVREVRRAISVALFLASVCALTTPHDAVAQAAKEGTDNDVLLEVVVTALKKEQSLLEVPAAISVLGGADLRTEGVNNLSDIQNLVPNVNITNTRDGVTVAMRGVQTTDTSSKGEQDIAFNIDGVYVGRGNARGAAFFDVDRVEILRGPQGTLYGRSSTGGAINVITNRPKLGETSGYARLEYGNYDAQRAEAAFNLPLGERWAVRVAGNANSRDGYSKPIAYSPTFQGVAYNFSANTGYTKNDQQDETGRFSLLFEPGSDATLRLTATIGHQGGAGNAPALETQLVANHDRGSGALSVLANPVPAFVDTRFQNYDGTFTAELGGVQLDLLGSYQNLDFKQQGTSSQDTAANGGGRISPTFLLDSTLTFGPTFQFYLQQNNVETRQAEARISNADPGAIDYVAGANYFKESAGENGQSWNGLISSPLDASTYLSQAGPVNVTTHESYAVFGQTTWRATEKLGVVTGVRYTHNAVDRAGRFALPFNFASGVFPPPPFPDDQGNAICTYPNNCVGNPNNGSASDNKATWRVGINYQATPANLLYASVATGFKGGGFNDYDPVTGTTGPYEASSLTAYEVGYKGRPLTATTLSSSVFYYDFAKNQITSGVTFPNGQYVIFTQAVPTTAYGWENEISYAFARKTSLSGSVSYLHTRFTDFQAGSNAFLGNGIDFSGQALDSSPEFVAIGSLDHAFDVGNGAQLKLRAAIKSSSSYLISDFADAVRYRQPSFTRSDASLTYEASDNRYSLQLFVENIENKVQRTGGLVGYQNSGAPYGGSGSTTFTSLPANNLAFYTTTPRFYGLRLSARF